MLIMKHSSSPRHATHSQPAASSRRPRPTRQPQRQPRVTEEEVAAPPPVSPVVPSAALNRQTVRIGLFRPEAREVCVAGTFNGWEPRETPLKRDSLGDWSVELSLPPGEHRYRLLADGQWIDDPSAQRMAPNPFGGFDAVIFV